MRKKHPFSCLKDERGSTIIEFALVAPILFGLTFAIIEFGMFTLYSVTLESAVTQAARSAAIGTKDAGKDRVTTIIDIIHHKTAGLKHPERVVVAATKLSNGATRKPDICMQTTNAGAPDPQSGPTCPPGTPFIEVNGVPGYQGNGGTDFGNPGDLVEVRASYPWQVMTPFMSHFFGDHGLVLISSSTVVKNEKF